MAHMVMAYLVGIENGMVIISWVYEECRRGIGWRNIPGSTHASKYLTGFFLSKVLHKELCNNFVSRDLISGGDNL